MNLEDLEEKLCDEYEEKIGNKRFSNYEEFLLHKIGCAMDDVNRIFKIYNKYKSRIEMEK